MTKTITSILPITDRVLQMIWNFQGQVFEAISTLYLIPECQYQSIRWFKTQKLPAWLLNYLMFLIITFKSYQWRCYWQSRNNFFVKNLSANLKRHIKSISVWRLNHATNLWLIMKHCKPLWKLLLRRQTVWALLRSLERLCTMAWLKIQISEWL